MIKSFTPQRFEGPNPLPSYAANVKVYTLTGVAPGGYIVTLGRLTVGDSMSAGNPLAHAMFESFTDHGERRKVARTRVSGHDREFIAAKNAMIETGVEFFPLTSCSCEDLLNSLGEWFSVTNPDITSYGLVSQSCH